jgi:hypothetical protein
MTRVVKINVTWDHTATADHTLLLAIRAFTLIETWVALLTKRETLTVLAALALVEGLTASACRFWLLRRTFLVLASEKHAKRRVKLRWKN